jgi:hypothetical protein
MGAAGDSAAVNGYLRAFRLVFLSFPDLYSPILKEWAKNMPILSCFLAGAAAWQILSVRHRSLAFIVRNPVVAIAVVVFVFGIFPPLEFETRYSHFLYPLALCVALMSAVRVGEILNRRLMLSQVVWKTLAIAFCLSFFLMSEDVDAHHLLHPNSDRVAYRMGPYEKFSRHWYPRWDFQRPAEFLNAAASDGATVIIMSSANTVGAYLKSDFVIYWRRTDSRFALVSREGGSRELWSGRRMLSTFQDLAEYTQGAQTVWLVFYPGWESLEPSAVWPGRVLSVEVHKPGIDKRIEVWRIELKGA